MERLVSARLLLAPCNSGPTLQIERELPLLVHMHLHKENQFTTLLFSDLWSAHSTDLWVCGPALIRFVAPIARFTS